MGVTMPHQLGGQEGEREEEEDEGRHGNTGSRNSPLGGAKRAKMTTTTTTTTSGTGVDYCEDIFASRRGVLIHKVLHMSTTPRID